MPGDEIFLRRKVTRQGVTIPERKFFLELACKCFDKKDRENRSKTTKKTESSARCRKCIRKCIRPWKKFA